MTVTNAYALSLCSQAGGYRPINSTISSAAARVSGSATPTNSTTVHNSTMHNGTFRWTPAPFIGGSGVSKGCGAMMLAGLLVGGIAVAL